MLTLTKKFYDHNNPRHHDQNNNPQQEEMDNSDELSRPVSQTSETRPSTSRLDTSTSGVRPRTTNNNKQTINEKRDEPKKKGTFKLLVRFFVSYLGMIIAVVLYVCGGAYLFQILEQHNEIQNCQTGEGAWDDLLNEYGYIF